MLHLPKGFSSEFFLLFSLNVSGKSSLKIFWIKYFGKTTVSSQVIKAFIPVSEKCLALHVSSDQSHHSSAVNTPDGTEWKKQKESPPTADSKKIWAEFSISKAFKCILINLSVVASCFQSRDAHFRRYFCSCN